MISLYKFYFFVFSYLKYRMYFWLFILFINVLLEGFSIAFIIPLLEIMINNDFFQLPSHLSFIRENVLFSISKLSLASLISIIIAIFLCKGIILIATRIYIFYLMHWLRTILLKNIITVMIATEYRNYIDKNIGEIINVLNAEVNNIVASMNDYLKFINNICLLVLYIILAILINYILFIICLLLSVPLYICYRICSSKIKSYSILYSKNNSLMHNSLLQLLNNFKYIKITGLHNIFIDRVISIHLMKSLIRYKMQITRTLNNNILSTFFIVVLCIFLYINLEYLELNLINIIAFIVIIRKLFGLMRTIGTRYMSLQSWQGSNLYYNDLYNHFANNTEINGDIAIDQINDDIILKNVTFQYIDNHYILDNVNIKIKNNQCIAIVGDSGEGKSTLLYIISGILSPSQGNIFLGNINYADINKLTFRQKIAYISQENIVLNDTVYNNITLWHQNSHQIDLLNNLSRQLNFNLNEMADQLDSNISGGELQRAKLLRELIKDSDLLLIDEITNHLDDTLKLEIKNIINEYKSTKTIIIIDHDRDFLTVCDDIYRLKDGHIALENYSNYVKS